MQGLPEAEKYVKMHCTALPLKWVYSILVHFHFATPSLPPSSGLYTTLYFRHPPEPEVTASQGNAILMPKTKGRTNVLVKQRKASKIESVVARILPTMWTGPITEYGLPSLSVGNDTKQADKNILINKEESER